MRSVIAIFLLFTLSLNAIAKCLSYPPLLVKIKVLSCQNFTVDSSAGAIYLETDDGEVTTHNIHNPKESYSATLLHGTVEDYLFVSDTPGQNMQSPREPYISHGEYYFELEGSAASVCPPHLWERVTLIAKRRCCDGIPSGGACLSPFTKAKIEPTPEKWYRLGDYQDESSQPESKKSWWSRLWS